MYLNGNLVKLGCRAPVPDRLGRTLKISKYLPKALPEPAAEVSWITKLLAAESLPMFLNDKLGTCVPAYAGHAIQQWNFYAGHPAQPSDTDILAAYCAVGGYVPGNPSTDNGTDMLAFLNYWRQVGIGGHKILAYAAADWTNDVEIRQVVKLFGNVMMGWALPTAAQGQNAWTVSPGGIYTPNGTPGTWGGHCTGIMASSPETDTNNEWATTVKNSHNFRKDYGMAAYAVLSQEWISATGLSPSEFDFNQLQVDLAEITA
jgi:hypothetical protein